MRSQKSCSHSSHSFSLDIKIPPAGGVGIEGYYFPPVDSVLNVWSLINNCRAVNTSEFTGYTLKQWNESENNAIIQFYLTKDGGHSWPGGLKSRVAADSPSEAVNANDLILDFLVNTDYLDISHNFFRRFVYETVVFYYNCRLYDHTFTSTGQ